MKKFRYFLLALAALALAASCTQKEEPFQPGDPDVSGCYGVYFPVQEAAGAHTYDPTMPTTVEFTVKRTNSSGAITVPVKYTESETGMFQVGTLSFADGQDETTLKVDFPNTDMGVNYTLSLLIDDPQYASQYNDGAVSIDFSVLRVEWKYFLNPKTGEKAVFTWNQSWWGETAYSYVKYYEVGNKRTCQTETFNHVYNGEEYDTPGFFGTGADFEWTFYWYTNTKNADGNNFIRIPLTNTGYHHGTYDADVYVLDYYYWDTDGDDDAEFLEYASKNSDTVSYYDGNGGFYLSARSYYMFGVGGWNPGTYDVVGLADGFIRVDYSVDMELDFAQNGVLPVYLEAGVDVASISLAGYEGELTPTQVSNKVADIAAGKEASAVSVSTADFELDEEEAKLYGATGLSFENTGVYTVVAVSFDAEGNAHESASAVHAYVSGDDTAEYAVKVKAGTEATPARFEGEEYDGKTSFAFYVLGEDITEAHLGIFDASKYNSAVEAYQAAVKADEDGDYALSADAIAAMNSAGGYYDVVTGAAPNTEYVVLVWATNGSEEAFATATFKTDGLPNEIVAEDGCFAYILVFNDEEGVPYYDYLPLELNPNNCNYELHNLGYGATFTFSYDEETGKVEVPRQPTGFANATYGTLFVGAPSTLPDGWADYFGVDLEPESYVDEDGNFHFYLSYYSSAGYYFGTGYEVYYLNGEPEEGEEGGEEEGGEEEGGEEGGEGEGSEGEGGEEGGASTSSMTVNAHFGADKSLQDAYRTGVCHERDIKAVTVKTSYVAPKHQLNSSKEVVLNSKLTDKRR